MGQRTAVLTTYINKEGVKTNHVYHCQWGIGRVMTNAIIGSFLTQMGEERFDLADVKDMYDESEYVKEAYKNYDELDFSDINLVHDIIKNMDNNNGGIVVICDDRNNGGIKMGFVLGDEECYDYKNEIQLEQPHSRFVTFEEWAEKVGYEYVDEEYKKMVYGFMGHFKVEVLNGKIEE